MVTRVRHQRRRRAAAVTVAATLTAAVAVAVTGAIAGLGGTTTPPTADRAVEPTTTQTPTAVSGDPLGPTPLDGTRL